MFGKKQTFSPSDRTVEASSDVIKKHHQTFEKNTANKNYLIIFCVFIAIIFCLLGGLFVFNSKVRNFIDLTRIFKSGKHLVLVQNNAELRPTGGFIGSIATFSTTYFIPKDFYYDTNIYKRDNDFTYQQKVIPTDQVLANFVPQGLLALRDSNWTIDYPKAATEIAWFYEQEGGTKVDTVVTIDTEFFKKLLHIVGPIKMVKYNLTIDENNFNEVIEQQIEKKYYEEKDNYSIHEPKTILAEMYPIVLARTKNLSSMTKIYNLILESLLQKNILVYSYDQKIEKDIIKNSWGGQVRSSDSDYLYINNANLGSNKTSIDVNEDISYRVDCSEEKCIANLNIKKLNTNKAQINKNFTSILVPQDAILLEANINNNSIKNNVEIIQKYNKDIFRFWTSVEPEQETKINLIYELPSQINKNNYSLIVQKQPGAVNQKLIVDIDKNNKFNSNFINDLTF